MSKQQSKDSILDSLVQAANKNGLKIDITLNVQGSLVSGTTLSAKDYFSKLSATIKHEGEVAHKLSEQLAQAGESIESSDDSEAYFIHLENAKVYCGQSEPMPFDAELLWRGPLEDINGFILEKVSESEEEDAEVEGVEEKQEDSEEEDEQESNDEEEKQEDSEEEDEQESNNEEEKQEDSVEEDKQESNDEEEKQEDSEEKDEQESNDEEEKQEDSEEEDEQESKDEEEKQEDRDDNKGKSQKKRSTSKSSSTGRKKRTTAKKASKSK